MSFSVTDFAKNIFRSSLTAHNHFTIQKMVLQNDNDIYVVQTELKISYFPMDSLFGGLGACYMENVKRR